MVVLQGIQTGKTLADPITIFPPSNAATALAKNLASVPGGLSQTKPVNAHVVYLCNRVSSDLSLLYSIFAMQMSCRMMALLV